MHCLNFPKSNTTCAPPPIYLAQLNMKNKNRFQQKCPGERGKPEAVLTVPSCMLENRFEPDPQLYQDQG